MMLLEIICCKPSVAFVLGEEEALIDWVYECYKDFFFFKNGEVDRK